MKQTVYILALLLGLQVFADRYDSLVLGPKEFIEKLPFKAEDVSFSNESVRTIRFLENTQKEIDFLGKLGAGNELYLNGVKIPTNKNRLFKFSLSFLDESERHEIKLVKPGISETALFFRLKTIQESPAPIRAIFKLDEKKTAFKSSVFTGKFPSSEWIQFSSIEPVEKMDPEFLAKQERERLEKERLERERLEQERLAQEKLEKERLEQERLAQEKLEKERLEQERLAQEKLEKERLEQERLVQEKLEKERLEQERQERARLVLEAIEKERSERKRLEEERQEKARLVLEQIEKERLEKERKEKARLAQEKLEREKLVQEKLEKEKNEKERLAQKKLERERQEIERLEKERLEKARLAQETLEKEKEETPRAPAAETNRLGETEEAIFFKEPTGIELEQGISFFSLTQAGNLILSSMNLQLGGSYKTSLFDNFEIATQAQIFLLPLSVTGAQEGPRLFSASGNLGWKLKADSGAVLTPQAGFQFQTLLTQLEIGYRNLGGPSLGVSYESPVGKSLFLHTHLNINFFSSDTQAIAFSNNQLGFRLFLEWRKSSAFFSSYYTGLEYRALSITLLDAQLSSSNTSFFFGLRF